jgi:hypothetical protein
MSAILPSLPPPPFFFPALGLKPQVAWCTSVIHSTPFCCCCFFFLLCCCCSTGHLGSITGSLSPVISYFSCYAFLFCFFIAALLMRIVWFELHLCVHFICPLSHERKKANNNNKKNIERSAIRQADAWWTFASSCEASIVCTTTKTKATATSPFKAFFTFVASVLAPPPHPSFFLCFFFFFFSRCFCARVRDTQG